MFCQGWTTCSRVLLLINDSFQLIQPDFWIELYLALLTSLFWGVYPFYEFVCQIYADDSQVMIVHPLTQLLNRITECWLDIFMWISILRIPLSASGISGHTWWELAVIFDLVSSFSLILLSLPVRFLAYFFGYSRALHPFPILSLSV